MDFLNLIRWKNLIMIAAVQVLIKYALFEAFEIDVTLNWFAFTLLVLATICIAAAGNIINDIYDIDADTINKPESVIIDKSISEKTAFNWFMALNVIGVGIGFYLSYLIGRLNFSIMFVGTSALLYIYASFLKDIIVVKNLIVSLIVALSILIIPLYDLFPAINMSNQSTQITIFKVVLDYAIFAFALTLIRELVKDIQDINGDHKAGINTLPIAVGKDRASKIAFALVVLFIIGISYYVITYLYKQQLAVVYFLILVIAPLIYTAIKLFSAENKEHFKHISNVLKIIMLLGMLSLLLYPFILK